MPTVSLAPMPKWYFVANNGDPLGAGTLTTRRAANPDESKLIYQDPAGSIPYPNPVNIDANGTLGPIYWLVDEPYYLIIKDSDGNVIYNINNFSPPSDGGSSSTTYINLDNLVVNGSFWRNIGSSTTPVATSLTLSPSAHSAFSTPDMTFTKTSTANSDTIVFTEFTGGTIPFTPSDITPLYFMNYTCTTNVAGETDKYVQFPIMPKVKNLEQQAMTFSIWARTNGGGSNTLTVWIEQFFGNGTNAPSASAGFADAQQITLTTDWDQYILHFTPASIGGKTIGNCHDDAVYLKIQYPLSTACNIDIAKPSLYTGNLSQETISNFETFDEVDSLINDPRMGDIRISLNAFQPFGWVPANDLTIGNASSSATARSNNDTFFLFKQIWDNVTNTFAPIYDSAGIATTRGASAIADFAANRRLQLTRAMGRVLAGINPQMPNSFVATADPATDRITVSSTTFIPTGTPVYLLSTGSVPGGLLPGQVYYAIHKGPTDIQLALSEDYAIATTPFIDLTTAGTGVITLYTALGATAGEGVITENELPEHTHPIQTYAPNVGSFANSRVAAGGLGAALPPPIASTEVNVTNNETYMSIMQPTAFYNIFIKL